MVQTFLDNVTGLPQLWACVENFVKKNRFSEARLDIDVQTGHLIAHESGNLEFSIDINGHLKSEVI